MSSDTAGRDRADASSSDLADAAEVFRALGRARRLRIMQLFVQVPDTLCGCEIADILGLEDYQVSRELSALKNAGLVESRERTGTWVHYQVASRPSPTTARLLETVRQLPITPRIEGRLRMRLTFRERAGCVLGVGNPEVLAAFDRADPRDLPVRD